MSPPDFYRIKEAGKNGYPNQFSIKGYEEYIKDPEGFRNKAEQQWNKLKTIFEDAGAEILILPARESNPPLSFTADPFISINDNNKNTTLISRFSNPRRLDEAEIAANFLKVNFPERGLIISELYIEGTGDNYYDPYRDIFWSGYDPEGATLQNASSGRSNIKAHKLLEALTGIRVISLAVKEPFFHIDTTLCPLPNGHILFYKNGIQGRMLNKFYNEAFDKHNLDKSEYLIEVSEQDALAFGCNARIVTNSQGKHTIVTPLISDELKDKIESKGYKVVTTDLSAFIADGGGPHCLSNNLNETRKTHD